MDQKATLLLYLDAARDALLRKAEGLSEYDLRRPLTGTGTNLLGLLKHCASMEIGYLGPVFGRPAVPLPWLGPDAEPNADLWATPHESREDVLALVATARETAHATVAELALDASGHVPWWTRPEVTLHQVLVHVIAELHRHAGHADVVRELVDGTVGMRGPGDNLPDGDAAWWSSYVERVEAAAREAAGRS